MSRLRVRRFLPVLIAFVIAALALLAFTQPWQASAVSTGMEDAAPPQFVPAAYVATETAAAPAEAKVQTPPVVSSQGTPTTAEPIAPANSLVHPARAGEAVTAIARMYLPQTPYMSTHELEAAIRRANPQIKGQFLKAGTQVIVPDIEPQPVVEHSIPRPRDFEVRAIYLTGTMAGSDLGMRIIEHWKENGGRGRRG